MNILALTEKAKPFVYLSTGKAFENLDKYIDCDVNVIDFREWAPVGNNEIDIFIFEAVYAELLNFSISDIKYIYPNAKIVCLGSDTIYFVKTNKNDGYQFKSPEECDLFLETMWDSFEVYEERGINVDHWDWTISEWLIEDLKRFTPKPWDEREHDFISLLSPHTIAREGSYRYEMVGAIGAADMSFTQGGGTGMADPEVDKIFESYCNSKITLGTSSHDNPEIFGRKGFRDAIGPFLGSILIYDDYKDVVADYLVGGIMPMYGYGKFEELSAIKEYLDNNPTHRDFYIERQKEFFTKNTIDEQLVGKFLDHSIIDFNDLQQ